MKTIVYRTALFFGLLSCQIMITSTIPYIPHENEIVSRIVYHYDPGFFKKIEIAVQLNKHNFFTNSTQKILPCLGVKSPDILFLNKEFYKHYCNWIEEKEKASQPYEIFSNDLILDLSSLNLSQARKGVTLNNLALFYFNLYQGSILEDTPLHELALCEPLVFALIPEKCNPANFSDPTNKNLFFENFNNITKMDSINSVFSELKEFTIDKKISLIYRLSLLNIKLGHWHATMLEKFIKTEDAYKYFIWLLENKNEILNSSISQERILSSLLRNPFWPFSSGDLNQKLKNALILTRLCMANAHNTRDCTNCTNDEKSIIIEAFKSIHRQNIWPWILEAITTTKKTCRLGFIVNNQVVDLIKSYHSNVDGEGLLEIISLFQRYPSIKFSLDYEYEELLNKNSNRFKNLLTFAKHCKNEKLKNRIDLLMVNVDFISNLINACYMSEGYFHDSVMKYFSCYCLKCNWQRFNFPIFFLITVIFTAQIFYIMERLSIIGFVTVENSSNSV